MGRREDNKRRKREAIERAGLEAFRTQGYAAASIEQIAAAADVARGTFYLYFPDKLALFDALVDQWYEPVQGVLADVAEALERAHAPGEAREVYQGMAFGLAVLLATHRDVVEIVFRESRQPTDAGRAVRVRELAILDQVTRFTADAAQRGLIAVGDPRVFALIVFGSVERLVYEWLMGTPFGDPRVVAEEVLRPFAAALGLG
ncbi:MAG: TetR/AcrR family transcriptional regulator [Myxococcota bacterium]